jgi:hypothetical protein
METLDKHFRTLAKAAFQRHGFASEQLISQWDVIVGPQFAAFCSPDKINWPKTAAESAHKLGGTLVIRAVAGRGLELQYDAARVIERVNQFLGYGAIASLKIMQNGYVPPVQKPAPAMVQPEARAAWATKIDDIADVELKAALLRFSAHAAPNGPTQTSPQGENGIGLNPQLQLGKLHD